MQRIINLLEVLQGVPSKINSFPFDGNDKNAEEEAVKKAEKLFCDAIKLKETDMSDDDIECFLEDAYYDNNNGYEIYIIWSE